MSSPCIAAALRLALDFHAVLMDVRRHSLVFRVLVNHADFMGKCQLKFFSCLKGYGFVTIVDLQDLSVYNLVFFLHSIKLPFVEFFFLFFFYGHTYLCFCVFVHESAHTVLCLCCSTPEGQRTTFGSQSFHPVDLSEGLSSVAC